jgi:hypothetical protein
MVDRDLPNAIAISSLVSPCAMSKTTWRSRRVRTASRFGLADAVPGRADGSHATTAVTAAAPRRARRFISAGD